jgi:hypothetical protein
MASDCNVIGNILDEARMTKIGKDSNFIYLFLERFGYIF